MVRSHALPRSLGEAGARAGIQVLTAESAGVRLVSVEVLAPVTEIQDRPVHDPQSSVRLVYSVGGSTVTVEEVRNPRPDRPMIEAIIGSTAATHIEDDAGAQCSYTYSSDGSRVISAVWGTPEVWVFVLFQPGLPSDAAQAFVRSTRSRANSHVSRRRWSPGYRRRPGSGGAR